MSLTTRVLSAFTGLVLAGLATQHASAAEPNAAQPQPKQNLSLPYPAKVPIVLQVNGPERIRERLTKMLAVLPPAESKLLTNQLDAGWKAAFNGRKLSAIPKDGRVFVVVHELTRFGDETPPVSVLIPVTSYQEFRATFLTEEERKTFEKGAGGIDHVKTSATGNEVTVHMVELKEYVALTLDKTVAEAFAAKYTRALSGEMGADLSASFLNADVSLYVNMDAINETHAEDIRNMRALMEFALQQAGMNDMFPGIDKKQLDAAKVMFAGLFQGIEDCRGIVLAAEIRNDGLNVRAQARFIDGSPTTQLLKDEKPQSLVDLSRLPVGMNSYTGYTFSPRLSKVLGSFNELYSAAPGDDVAALAIEKARAELAAAGPGGSLTAEAADGSVQVLGYKSPDKAVAAEAKLFKALTAGSKVNGIILKEKPRVAEGARTIRGVTCTEIAIVLDIEATVAALPEQARAPALAMYKRANRERSTTWIGSDGKVVYQIIAKDWPAAQKTLEAYLDGNNGVGNETGFQLTRKNLPSEATAIMLFETQSVINMLLDYARETLKSIPADLPPIGKPKTIQSEATYIGVALSLRPQSVTLDLFVPKTSMNVAARMLVPLFKPLD